MGRMGRAAEIVVTFLSDDDAVREVVLEGGGLAKLLEDRLYIDASTVSPTLCAELAEQIERYIALPVAGAPSALREGQAIVLAGGPGELINEAVPLIESLSRDHLRFPRAELAAAAKIANNNLLLIGLAALAESVAVARAGGLSDQQIHNLFDGSAMLAPGIRNRLDAVLAGEGPVWWSVDLGVKDAGLATDVSRTGRVKLPLTVAAAERYEATSARGLGEEDLAAVGRLYQANSTE
jgi:3-hydroxyisobutyrate dehydrogenase-like beta-hydroxyacid dehydrogenase